ncbi:unnamed protein product [Symbiodinium sp. CCMP2456]|nr:unnamed protein product [Symbiodinium sp. CCMP2456]
MREIPWLLPMLLSGRAHALPACDAMCETYWGHYRNLRNLSQPASSQAELAKDVSRYLDVLAEGDIECAFPCIQFSELVGETASPVVQRLMHEFTHRADRHLQFGKAKVTLCDDMVRYHTQGLLDLVSDGDTPEAFAPKWWASGSVLPMHKSVAYIQLSQRRCQVGMVAANAIVARFLRQMGERLARTDYFLHATVAQQCLVAAYASAPMLPDAAEVGISNWRGIYRLFSQDQPAFPAEQPSWRYAWSSDNEEQTWLQQRHCQLVWAQAPSLTALARTLVAAAFVEAKRRAAMMTRSLLQAAAAESIGHSRCHVASTVAQLTSLSVKLTDGVDEASCIAVREVWDELRQTLGTEAVLHSKFAPWGVLLFGLLHHVQGQVRAWPTHCRLGSLREVCEPKGLAAVTAEGLRKVVAGRLVPSVPAIMAFLSEISTLCNRGVAAAHLALAQSVLLLTAQADLPLLQTQRQPLRAPTCHNGGFQSPSAEAWVSRLSRTQMEVVTKELPELSYAWLRIPMRRQNLSSFTQAVLAEDIAQLLEEAWTILAGEQIEGLLEGTWPLAELGWKFFACLTVIRPPPEILRQGRFS